MSLVRINHEGTVSIIYLNRPEKKNALNPALVSALSEAFSELERRIETTIVVLTGEGDVFSAGADLAHIQELAKNTFEENLADSKSLKELFYKIYNFPKPVIAKVNGHAIAGGGGLASVCDIVLMKESAKVGYTEVKIGFIAAIVMVFLCKIVGEKVAKDLLFTGRLLTAKEAKSIGLVSHVYADNDFELSCDTFLSKLSLNSPQALKSTKELFKSVQELPMQEALNLAVKKNAETRASYDCKEGISAFLEKRKAVWSTKQ